MRNYDLHIVQVLGDNKYIVEATPNTKPKSVGVAHDFVQFTGTKHLSTKGNLTFKEHPDSVQSNVLSINTSVQIPIRMFQKQVLPYLNNHPNSQPEHLEDRVDKDGNKYPPYAYYSQNIVVSFYDISRKEMMVAVLEPKQREPNIVTLDFYNKYIKPNS